MTLSEDSYDKLVQPIVDRQEKINTWVLEQLANKIKEMGDLTNSDSKKLFEMLRFGGDAQRLVKRVAELTKLQVIEIQALIEKVAELNYVDTKPFFDFRQKSFIPFEENTLLQRRVKAIARQTANTYKNMAKAQAFMLRDLKNPSALVPTPLSEVYQTVVDEAIQASQGGIVDYYTAMRRTMKQLAASGLRRVEYYPEKWINRKKPFFTQRMDTAVRRNVLDGIRAVNQEMQHIVGEQFSADGVEISVHLNPAPDHAEMQGHQYYLKEFEKMQLGQDFKDVQGRSYKGFERAVGTLNCRHFAISIIVGAARQNYSDKELQEILEKNEKGYTLPNGKHLTMYECTQVQRKIETEVRYAKDGQILALKAGDEKLAKEYQARINEAVKKYKAFSKACGLQPKMKKMEVEGYKKISVK
jgi:hypothetical protein